MSIEHILGRCSRKKGQAFASDFLMGTLLFIIILFAAVELWGITSSKYARIDSGNFMQQKAFSITDALIKTEGYPKDWTNGTVEMLGIAENMPNVLNKSKLLEMKNISHAKLKNIWGLSDYNVHLNFTNSSGNTVVLGGIMLEYGLMPQNKKDLIPMKRIVLINDSGNLTRSVLTFIIWR